MTDHVNIRDDALPGKGQPTDMFPATQNIRMTDHAYNDTMLFWGIRQFAGFGHIYRIPRTNPTGSTAAHSRFCALLREGVIPAGSGCGNGSCEYPG